MFYEFELGKAADQLVRELLKLKKGETFVITADTMSDERVVNAMAKAAFAVDAKPMVIWTSTPMGTGKMTDDWLPAEAMRGALKEADAWVEVNHMYLLYSDTFNIVMKENAKLRFLCLPAMNTDVFVRLFARVDHPALKEFLNVVTEMTRKAHKVRLTSPAGEDVEFVNNPEWPFTIGDGYADTPGTFMLGGQVSWTPVIESVNGVIVADGSLVPQFGVVEEPVKIHVEKGVIQKVEGGKDGLAWEAWLRSFNHPQMMTIAHVSYGFNPQAKLTGQIGEDERVWGCTQWGFGAIGSTLIPPNGIDAPSHTDAITLNTSIYLDGKQITNCGVIVDPELKALAERLGLQ